MYCVSEKSESKSMNNFKPSRLRDIRIIRGFTTEQLAKQINVTKQSVSKYECGLSIPSSNIIEKLIDVLNIPRNYLSKDEITGLYGSSPIFFRTSKSTKKSEVELANIQSKWAYEIIFGIKNIGDINSKTLPNLYEEQSIEEKTLLLREYWELGFGPIDNLTKVLERNGCYIFVIDTNEIHVDAYSQIVHNIPIIILNKCKGSPARWRFDLAHELGHLILHSNITRDRFENEYDIIEKEANIFASNFLMPSQSFGSSVLNDKLDYFIQLKKDWKVSIAAMIYRCNHLNIFNNLTTKKLQIQLSKRKWRVNEPLDDEIQFEKPELVANLIRKYANDINSAEKFLNVVRLPLSEVERLCSLDKGYFSKYTTLNSNNQDLIYMQLSMFQ